MSATQTICKKMDVTRAAPRFSVKNHKSTRSVRFPVASYASLGITATSSTFAVFDRTTLGTTTTSTSSSPVDLSLTPLLPFSSGYQVPLSIFTLSTSTTVFASSPLLSSSTSYFPFDSSFSSATGTLTGTPVNNPTFGVGKVYQALVVASILGQSETLITGFNSSI